MHTVELLEQALATAVSLGYKIRHEWLDGASGGACCIGGQRWIFLDLAHDCPEQLDQVAEALREDPLLATVTVPEELQRLLGVRRAA
ncbi:MAG: hypothetical protein WDZ59_16735 [Pirellulales bacterium]